MSLKAILHYEHMMEVYREGADSVETPLTDLFYKNPETVYSDDATLFVDPVELRPAKLNRRSAPARMMDLKSARQARGVLFRAFNQKQLPNDLLHGLSQPDNPMVDRMGAREARRQLESFGRQHAILKELALAKFLTVGSVYADVEGNILESASADDETYSFGVAAGHQNQLDWDGNGDIIGTEWDEAGADILGQFITIDDAARQSNAAEPDLVITNSKTKIHISNNTDFQTWAAASGRVAEQVLQGKFVENLFGKNWMFVDGTYENSAGTVTKFIPDEKVVLVPSDVSKWLRPVQGVEMIPTTLELQATLDALLGSVGEAMGRFSYAAVEHNPVALDLFMGDNFGWVLANPNAIWQATVAT